MWPMALPLAYRFPWLIELANVRCASMRLAVTRQSFRSFLIVLGSAAMYGTLALVRSGRRGPRTEDQGLWPLFSYVLYLCVVRILGANVRNSRISSTVYANSQFGFLIFHTLRLPIVARNSSSPS